MNKNISFVLLLGTLAALAGFGAYLLVINSDCVENRSIYLCLTHDLGITTSKSIA